MLKLRRRASRTPENEQEGISIATRPIEGLAHGAIVSVRGGVDALDGKVLAARLHELVRGSHLCLAVDLHGVHVLTERGLVGALLAARAHLRSRGGHLVLFGLRKGAAAAFSLLYRSSELRLFSTAAAAVRALRAESADPVPLAREIPGFQPSIEALTLAIERAEDIDRCAIVRCAGRLTEKATTPFWYDLDRIAEFGFTRLVLDCTRLVWGSVRGAAEFCKSFMLSHAGCIALFGHAPMARLLTADGAMPGCNSFWCDDEASALAIFRKLDEPRNAPGARTAASRCPKCGRELGTSGPGIHSCAGCGAVVVTDVFAEARLLPDEVSA